MLSTDNLCKQFGTRSGLKEFFENINFEKNQQTTKAHANLPNKNNIVIIHRADGRFTSCTFELNPKKSRKALKDADQLGHAICID